MQFIIFLYKINFKILNIVVLQHKERTLKKEERK